MQNLKNNIRLLGNLGDAPKTGTLSNGSKWANLSLATSETYTNKDGEKVTETQWHNVGCFGKLAELVEKYCEKGDKVAISGKLKYKTWDSEKGEKHKTASILADEVLFLSPKSQDDEAKKEPETVAANGDELDDIPF